MIRNDDNVKLGFVGNCVCGGLGAICASILTHPLDLFKVRLQLYGELNKNIGRANILTVLNNIYSNEGGIKAFYNGLSATILRQALYSTSRFGIYEQLKIINNP